MIRGRTTLALGFSQLICWGVGYYLIGGFGTLMVADLGWSPAVVQGGFSAALLVTGVSSPWIGRLIDRYGGRPVMAWGSVFLAIGCLALAASHDMVSYYIAWACLGLAMRMTLYDAAFAALARIGGPGAKRAMSQITLLGGLASTVFWTIGGTLAEAFGWRWALVAYAGFALASLPLHLAIPRARYAPPVAGPNVTVAPVAPPLASSRTDRMLAGFLYALITMMTNALNTAMSAHMIGILAGLGVAATAAVWIASLRGIGQSISRFGEVLFGRRLHALDLTLLACAGLPFCFVLGLWSGSSLAAAIGFAAIYGAGNGLATITRGTLPLVLFDPRTYGTLVGQLITPGFILSAATPLLYVLAMERFGTGAALWISAVLATLTLAAAITLKIRFGARQKQPVVAAPAA